MSAKDENNSRHVCSSFESQTWRKSLCKNCFHTLNEHCEELLAKEAVAVAKEKDEAAIQASSKPPVIKPDLSKNKSTPTIEGKKINGIKAEKEKSTKDVKGKFGATKDTSKEDSSMLRTKEISLENGNSVKPATLTTTKSTKSKTPTTTSSFTPSPTNSPVKSPLRSTTSSSTSTATVPSSTAITNSITSEASNTTSSTNPQKAPVSKTKNFASKFESKASILTKDKPSKPPDTRPATLNAVTTNGKSAGDSVDSKSAFKPPPEKLSENKSPPPKLDSKTPRKVSEETKLPASKVVKSEPNKINASKLTAQIDDKKGNDDGSDKKSSLLASKLEIKDSKTASAVRPKAAIFSKDILTSAKYVMKQTRSSPEAGEDKQKSSQSKDEKTMKQMSASSENEKQKSSQSKDEKTMKQTSSSPENEKQKSSQSKDERMMKQTRSSPEAGNEKQKSSQSKDENKGTESIKTNSSKTSSIASATTDKASTTSKSSVGKVNENKTKQQENESKAPVKVKDPDISQEASNHDNKIAAIVNKTGHLGKIAGKSSDIKAKNNSEIIDISKTFKGRNKKESSPVNDSAKIDSDRSSRDREKERKEGNVSEKKIETVSPSPIGVKQTISTSVSSSKNTTPPSTAQPGDIKSSKFSSETKSLKTLKPDVGREAKSAPSSLDKFKGLEKTKDKIVDKQTVLSPVKSPSSSFAQAAKKRDESSNTPKEESTKKLQTDVQDAVKLKQDIKEKEEKVLVLSKKLSDMEEQVRALEEERSQLKGASLQNQKKDTETMLNDLRMQLSRMESQCSRLERDNQALIDKLHIQEATVKLDQETRGKNTENVNLVEDLEVAEKELEEVKGINQELQTTIMDMKNEMDELYDHFRESEHEEFRELQKELDITAKNCRILQFKLRKAERCNDQIEEDRIHYEEKLKMLQSQFDSKDAKNHIRVLEEELRVAKEVSVRLHDELDIVEDKRNKALDDNRHLTELLEHTDRRQFRLEMEVDKLRDMVSDLKQQLKDAQTGNNNNNNNNKESSPDRKVHSTIYTRSID